MKADTLTDSNCFSDEAVAQMEQLAADFGRMHRERNEAPGDRLFKRPFSSRRQPERGSTGEERSA